MSSPFCQHCGNRIPDGSRFCPQCGSSLGGNRPSETAPEGPAGLWEVLRHRLREATAPRYRILRLLGSGGMAGVYLGEEPKLARKVAVKVMAPALMVDPRMVERFQQEARSTARLSHPHIITIHEIDERDGLHYFVMAYVEGPTLDEVLKKASEPLPAPRVRRWLVQMAGALQHAHRAGVVHRDMKPGNVMLDRDDNAVVTDFGIAKVADEPGLTSTGMLVGTPSYMSPEQCMGGEVTGAADQYALGALAYHLLCGTPPFTGTAMAVLQAHLAETPRPLLDVRHDCPPALAEVVHRMLRKDPGDRFPSMAEVVEGLDGVGETWVDPRSGLGTPVPPPMAPAVGPIPAAGPPAAGTPVPPVAGRDLGRGRRASGGWVAAGVGVPVLALALFLLTRGGNGEGEPRTAGVEPAPTAEVTVPPAGDPGEGLPPPDGTPPDPAVEPSADPGGEAPEGTVPAGAASSPAAAPPPSDPTPTPPAPSPPAASPAPALLEVAGTLPPDARLRVTGEAGAREVARGAPLELPAGRYLLEASAEGREGERREVTLAAGERFQWVPDLVPLPPPAAPAAFDPAAARASIEASLASLAAAFRSRRMDQVIQRFPTASEEWRERWGAVVENTDQIRDLEVQIRDVDHRRTEPEAAEVAFVLDLGFMDFRNRANQQRHPFIASLVPGPGGWIVEDLRSAP